MLHTDDCERMKADLESREVRRRDGPRDGPATIFRVPPSLRDLNEESYNPKYLSFGLYRRRNALLYTICLDFVCVFKEITQKDWSSIYSKALEGKSVKDWMNLYDGIKLEQSEEKDVEEMVVKEEPEASLAWKEETGKSFLAWDAIFVVCFLLADHLRNCGSTCLPNFPFLRSLKDEIEKKTVAPLVHMIRLDIFKYENQIPLDLIKNVFNMICSMDADQPSTSTSTPDIDHKLTFDTFVTHAVCSIYCDLPKPPNLREFKLSMRELHFEKRTHLLECLYSVVCYQPESSTVIEIGRPSAAARETVSVDEENQGATDRPQSGYGGSRSQGTTGAQSESVSVDVGNQGATDPPQNSNGGHGGSRSQGRTGVQSLHDDADPSQNSSGGGRDGTSDGAQRDVDTLQNSDGGVASRNGFADTVEWMLTYLADTLKWMLTYLTCQGSQTHRHGQRRHDHTQGLGIPTITKLKAVNIAVKREDKTKWMSEVNFRTSSIFNCQGELYLPAFAVFDETQTLLRNLLVYECTGQNKRDLLSFIHLLNNLINTEEDVRWMKASGVLKNNSLGTDKAVADMWNTMLSGFVIVPSRHYQIDVFDKIAIHSKKFLPKRVGELKILYNKPWQFFGLLAATITIVATILAMVYTITTYYYGNKQRH